MSILPQENASGLDSAYPLPELRRSTEYTEHFTPAAPFRKHSKLKLPPSQRSRSDVIKRCFHLSVWRYSGHQPGKGAGCLHSNTRDNRSQSNVVMSARCGSIDIA